MYMLHGGTLNQYISSVCVSSGIILEQVNCLIDKHPNMWESDNKSTRPPRQFRSNSSDSCLVFRGGWGEMRSMTEDKVKILAISFTWLPARQLAKVRNVVSSDVCLGIRNEAPWLLHHQPTHAISEAVNTPATPWRHSRSHSGPGRHRYRNGE